MPGVGCIASVCERGPEVVVLELEASDPRSPLGSTKGAVRGVRQRREVLRVRSSGSCEAAALGKALERIVAHRVEQVVARVGARERDGDDRLVDERAEQLDHRHLVEPVLGARRRRAPGEAHRLGAPRRGGAASSRPHAGGRSSTRRASRARRGSASDAGRSRSSSRRRLTRARSSASPSTLTRAAASSIASGRPSTRRLISAASQASSSVSSKPGRAARARAVKSSTAGAATRVARSAVRQRERVDDDSHLSQHMEHLAARGEHPHVRAVGEKCRDDARALLEDVLARVEDEDRVGVAKARDGARERVGAAHVEGLGDEADDVGRAGRAGEADVPGTSPELALERAGRLEREPALADPRRAGQRHEAMLPQELDHLGELRLAADERGRRTRAGCRAASGPRARARSQGRARGSPPGDGVAPAPARAPAAPRAPAGPPGTPRARPPGVRCDRAPASAVPTGARGTGSPRAQRGSPGRLRRALRARAPPRSAPPTRRAAASPAARPRPSPTRTEADPGAPARARARARRRSCLRLRARLRRGAPRAQRRAAPRTQMASTTRALERVPVGGEPDRVLAQRPAQAGRHGAARRFEALPEDRSPTAPRPACPWRRPDPIEGQACHERLPLGARHVHRLPCHDHLERPQEPNLELSHTACPPLSRAVWHAGLGGARLRYAAPMRAARCGAFVFGPAGRPPRMPPPGRASSTEQRLHERGERSRCSVRSRIARVLRELGQPLQRRRFAVLRKDREEAVFLAHAEAADYLAGGLCRRRVSDSATRPPGAARGSGRRAQRQQHGSRPRDAPSDPYEQGDEMSTALGEMSTACRGRDRGGAVERRSHPDDGRVRGQAPVGPAHGSRPLPQLRRRVHRRPGWPGDRADDRRREHRHRRRQARRASPIA